MSFIAALLSLAFIFGLSITGLYFLFLLITNLQPSRKKLSADTRKMQVALSEKREELIPLEGEELSLLSLNHIDQSRKKGVVAVHQGMLTTIYHEPVIAYMYRRYPGKPVTAILFARTKTHEFIYTFKKGRVLIEVDGSPLGDLRDNSRLYGARTQQLLASIDRNTSEQLLPVSILDKEVGQLTRPSQSTHANSRAFQLLAPMKPEEQLILLSLTILEAVSSSVDQS